MASGMDNGLRAPRATATNDGGRAIVRTARFVLQRLAGATDVAALRRWLNDPRIATAFGGRSPAPSEAAVAEFVAGFDGRSKLLLAIREIDLPSALGFYHLQSDRINRTLRLSMAVGERSALGKDVLGETGPALLDWVFASTRTEKIIVEVAERNRLAGRAVEAWVPEEGRLRGEIRRPGSDERITIVRYGLLREEWRSRPLRQVPGPK